tara:strand:+ start:68 stop:448 length:381 start_codon:yes stop_codon:yes gene_type:complete
MPYKNKEDQKKWVDSNQGRIKEAKRNWYLKNKNTNKYKESIKKGHQTLRKKRIDEYHRVYLLEDYNYVGVTKNILQRFNSHKNNHNRDCTNHRILYKTKDRSEALELEELLHDIGYDGKHHKNLYQ